MNSENSQHQLLESEFARYQDLHARNLLNQDNVLVQLSVGLLAILAGFGENILSANVTLGYIVVAMLGLTIVQVVTGYFLSNRFFIFAKQKLNDNYTNNIVPVTKDLSTSLVGKLNSFINVAQFFTFTIGIIVFAILFFVYLGGFNNG